MYEVSSCDLTFRLSSLLYIIIHTSLFMYVADFMKTQSPEKAVVLQYHQICNNWASGELQELLRRYFSHLNPLWWIKNRSNTCRVLQVLVRRKALTQQTRKNIWESFTRKTIYKEILIWFLSTWSGNVCLDVKSQNCLYCSFHWNFCWHYFFATININPAASYLCPHSQSIH